MFEPGPLVPSEMPLRPRVVLPFTFEALAAEFPFTGSSVDAALETHARTLAPFVNLEMDRSGDAAIATAVDGLDALTTDPAALGDVHATIDSVVDDVATQVADLPGVDEAEPTAASPDVHEPDPGDAVVGIGVPRPTPAPPGGGVLPPDFGKPSFPAPAPPPAPTPPEPTPEPTSEPEPEGPVRPSPREAAPVEAGPPGGPPAAEPDVTEPPPAPEPAPEPTPEPAAPDRDREDRDERRRI